MFKSILLQQVTAPQAGGNSSMMSLLFMAGIFVVFYFFMIRPQQKRQKEQVKFRDAVKKGDRIVTIGGLHGKIVELTADTFILDVDRGVKLTFERTSISVEGTKRFAGENQKPTAKLVGEDALKEN